MSKYIVKKCPACHNYVKDRYTCEQLYDTDMDLCKDYTKCVIKEIVEKCKLFQNNYLVNDGVQLLTTNILNSLDIQEVE